MDTFIEIVVEILLAPFESKIEDIFGKTKKLTNKHLKLLLTVFISIILLAIIFGLFCIINYIFTGHRL